MARSASVELDMQQTLKRVWVGLLTRIETTTSQL